MLKELRNGLINWRAATDHALGCLEFSSDEGDDDGVYQYIRYYHEKNIIFRIYFDVVCRDIDLDDPTAVLDALKTDRAEMQDFVNDTVKNEYPPHQVKCAKYALLYYDQLIRKIEDKS